MPEITEANLMAAFGLAEKSQGGQEQAPAEPAANAAPEEHPEGAQEQEFADPAEGSPETGDETPAEAEGGEQPEKQPQTQQQRRANAARRRQLEQQAAVDQAVSAAIKAEQEKNDAAMAQFFKDANLKNTFTGKPITTMDEFREWKQAYDQAQTTKAMNAGKLTPKILDDAIARHPAVQKAQAVVQQAEAAEKQRQEAANQARIQGELAEIGKLMPGVKTVADILAMPTAEAFRENVKKGHNLLDAFRLANFDRLTASRAEAARQQALNNARGKDHLSALGNSRGAGAESVPADQMRYFRMMMPDATDAQIQAYYNKHKPK